MYDQQQYPKNGRVAQEEASARKAAVDTQYFWNQVARNSGQLRVLRIPKPQNRAREETQLFGNHTEVLQGVIQDSIPVERSGPGADGIAILEKFSDLNNLPSFIARNIRLMRYESPSPIQVTFRIQCFSYILDHIDYQKDYFCFYSSSSIHIITVSLLILCIIYFICVCYRNTLCHWASPDWILCAVHKRYDIYDTNLNSIDMINFYLI